MSVDSFNVALLIGAAVLLVAVLAVRVSSRAGLPSLLVYLALGMIMGSSGLGVRFDDANLARLLGTGALVIILAEGGLTTRWSSMRPVLSAGLALATVGVMVSVAIVGAAAHLLLGIEWHLAMLIGAVVSSTDAAAVFSTLRRVRLPPRISALLELESGLNDAPAVLLVAVLTSGSITDGGDVLKTAALIGYELAAGAVIGLLVGAGGVWLLRRSALPAAGLYPLATVGLTVLAYGAGTVAHASGFLAVYVAGVLLGNARLPHRQAVLGFADGLAWLAQIGLFVLLGLLVNPNELGSAVIPGVVLGLVLVLLARPAAVATSVSWFGFSVRQQTFLAWAGLRGAVPIVFATIPLAADVEGAQELFNVVFVLVLVFTVLQGTTLGRLAAWLRVTDEALPSELRVESAPLEKLGAELLQVAVAPGSGMCGVYVGELRLPAGVAAALIMRDGRYFTPTVATRIREGDELLLVASEDSRTETEARLKAVADRGRLAHWLG